MLQCGVLYVAVEGVGVCWVLQWVVVGSVLRVAPARSGRFRGVVGEGVWCGACCSRVCCVLPWSVLGGAV